MEETFCYGDLDIAFPIITRIAAEIVQVYLYEIIAVDKS
jgi:hypothetical protein